MYQGQGVFDEFKDVFKKPNNELIQIILINIGVFVVLTILEVFLTLGGSGDTYGLIVHQLVLPSSIQDFFFKPWTLLTYFFTHERIFHILFNMWFLYWFGKLIVEYLGSSKLFSLYFLGGITGGFFYILIYNILPIFQDRVMNSTMLGASAGVFAVVVGAATLIPNHTFFLLLLGPVRIKYIAIFFVFLSFADTIGTNAGGEIAHLGGAFIGYLFVRQIQKGNDLGIWIITARDFIKSFFVSKPKIKVSYKRPGVSDRRSGRAKTASVAQYEIDAILDKISDSGYDSLTKEEKEKLFNASKK